jgi:hypothetical protein
MQATRHPLVLGSSNRQRGHVVTIAAILFPGLLAMMGLALDGGYVYHVKRRMQTAADAGALGGAHELWRGNTTLAEAAAETDAEFNGFPASEVTVNIPPLSGSRAGDANFVEVIIERDVPTYFLRIVNRQSATVKARAVAGLVRGAGGCVMAMDPNDRGALTVQGTSTLTASCGVMVNSNDSQAIRVPGGGCIYAGEIGVTGGWNDNGTQCTYPAPSTSVPRALDPLAYLTEPTPANPPNATNLQITNGAVNGAYDAGLVTASGGQIYLKPGTYKGGLKISGSMVNFEPGTYILDGGGFEISGNSVLTGNGVTFFNTNTGGAGQWGNFSIAGTARLDLQAPTSGDYEGMLFWNDNDAPDRPPGHTIAGTSDSVMTGAIYIPSGSLNYAGTSTSSAWNQIIANTITISGNAVVASNFGSSDILPPTRLATLVE